MTTFKYATIMFALILVTAACATDDPLTSDTAAGSTATTQDGEAHETGEAPDDGDAGETGEAHEDGDAHEEEDTGTMVMEDDNMVMEDEAHEDGDTHDDAHDEGAPSDADIAAADRSIEITMNEFTFSPASIEVSAGETIEFVASNVGVIEHEFRLSNDHRVEEHIAAGHESHGDEGGGAEGGHQEEGDKMILVQPGESASLVVTFTEDTTFFTNVVCLIPDHFEAGMQGELDYAA